MINQKLESKILSIILSCKTMEQLNACERMISTPFFKSISEPSDSYFIIEFISILKNLVK